MRGKIFFILLLLPALLFAKKVPKWKPGKFVEGKHGIRFAWKKHGTGDSLRVGDYVNFRIFFYNTITHKFDPTFSPSASVSVNPKTGSVTKLTPELQDNDIIAAFLQLRVGDKVFCILPNNSPTLKGDSSLCYIEVTGSQKGLEIEPAQNDSINFVMSDPNASNFGDSLFTSAKLVKAPTIISCGTLNVTQVFEFELSWFDNGVQHKNILVYIQCPDFYGKNYFVEGKSYIITAIPLTDNKKKSLNAVDMFPNETLERYYLLRIK